MGQVEGAGALVVNRISVSFGGVKALTGVSLEVGANEIVGIIGPNGAGKTTLFDCISGHLNCSGSVSLGGRDLSAMAAHQRSAAGLGRSYQDARLYPSMLVLDTLRTASELAMREGSRWAKFPGTPASRRGERAAADRADEIVDLLGLAAYAGKFVRELSTGTRRVVDLGCLLIQRPSVILFDEPSSGIAQREAEALGPLLRRIRSETGAALLVIEHDMPLLLGISDRLYASYLGDDLAAINRSGASRQAV
jgi:ABC-type branched-subunit amino acid transport system ATPase component